MLTILLSSLIFFFVFFRMSKQIILSFLGFLFGLVIGFLISICLPTKIETKRDVKTIKSIRHSSCIEDSFSLSNFIYEGSMYIYYNCEQSNFKNQFKIEKVNSEDLYISYEGKNPSITRYYKVRSNHWINMFSIDLYDYKEEYLMKIPENTVFINLNKKKQKT